MVHEADLQKNEKTPKSGGSGSGALWGAPVVPRFQYVKVEAILSEIE